MFTIYRKSVVGSINDRGGTQPFEIVALGMIAEFLSKEASGGKPIKSSAVDPMHDTFEVVGPNGRAVSVRLGDAAYDDDGAPLNREAVMRNDSVEVEA